MEPNRTGTIIVSAEQLVDEIVLQIQANGQTTPATFFAGYQCVCIEDVDWYYQREYTQFELARIISRVAAQILQQWLPET